MSCERLRYAQGAADGVIEITVVNACDGIPINLTGLTVAIDINSPSGQVLAASSVSVPDPTSGRVDFTLTSAETMEVGRYQFSVRVQGTLDDATRRYSYMVYEPITAVA